jgi:hypothetical protein
MRELAYVVVTYLLIELPFRAAEELTISWVRDEVAGRLNINRPPVITVAVFIWNWIRRRRSDPLRQRQAQAPPPGQGRDRALYGGGRARLRLSDGLPN